MFWEFFINVKSHLNEAIFYSMIGDFATAKSVIDTKWFLFYMAIYIFTMWDCYRIALDLNKYSQLADRNDSPIMPFNIGALEINYLDYRKPWSGVIWSLFMPGLGSVYGNRLPTGLFVLICTIFSVYQSNVLPAFHWMFEGKLNLVRTEINPQWFLNLPSLWGFALSSTYIDIHFTNQLFKTEQSRYLTEHYQPLTFKMPQKNKGSKSMHLISTFQHSAYLELALSDLEQEGISKDNIFVASLDKNSPKSPDVERAHKESASRFELAFILATIFMLLGSIYGFILVWGPIIWALIGLVFGAILGVVITLLVKKNKWFKRDTPIEVVVIVECEKHQLEVAERILWKHKSLGVAKTS
ncbi:MAG: putative rane protein [Paenibacillus sp.]|nr:putative rane protein [Paenibacillus sp.]